MTRLSKRYALGCAILLALAFALLSWDSRHARIQDDCANPDLLRQPDRFDSLVAFEEDGERQSEAIPLWTRGFIKLERDPSPRFEVVVMRSREPIRLYLQPDGLNPMPSEPDKGSFEWVESGSDKFPIHFLYTQSKNTATWRTAFTAYMFVYDNRPTAHPFMAQLASAVPDLMKGRRPLTLLMVKGAISTNYLEEAEELARTWLIDSWKRYQEVCSV